MEGSSENKINVLLNAWNNFFSQITKDARSFLLLLSLAANVWQVNEIKSLNTRMLEVRTQASQDVITELKKMYDPKINKMLDAVETTKVKVDSAAVYIKKGIKELKKAK